MRFSAGIEEIRNLHLSGMISLYYRLTTMSQESSAHYVSEGWVQMQMAAKAMLSSGITGGCYDIAYAAFIND